MRTHFTNVESQAGNQYSVTYLEVVELRQLASFLAVVEEGQFARAAARLFLSPPAVTGHIQRLERELGVQLLERSPITLTPAGERLVPHARTMLAAANAASDAVTDLHNDEETPLRVGVMAPGSAELTPAILRAFRRAQPHTPLTVESLTFAEHTTALTEQRVDVAFVRPPPVDERLRVDVLTTEPRVLIVPSAGPVGEADAVRLSDVLDLVFVGIPENAPRVFTDYLYFASARNGMPPHRGVDEASTIQDVLTSVSAGRGTGAALYSFTRLYRWPGISFVPVLDAPWEQSVLASRRNDTRPQVRAFRMLAATLARDLGPRLAAASEAARTPGQLEL
ncbi:MAG: LysR family transcriptional regulator [Actinoallomurus sp.]|jgi:DNA-binding transcriptional LysR family regulator|nr:LysR family transcriptional regulator [Actinoallomurus sp.]